MCFKNLVVVFLETRVAALKNKEVLLKCKTAVIQPHQTVGSIKYLVITSRVPNKATHGYDEGLIDSSDGDKVTVMILESKEVNFLAALLAKTWNLTDVAY